MAKVKISNIARDLNISVETVYDSLRKKNISVVETPNTRLEEEVVNMLMDEFQADRALKNSVPSARKKAAEPAPRAEEKPSAPKAGTPVESVRTGGPRILGKIELDKHGNPVRPKPEAPKAEAAPTAAPAPEAPKAEAPKTEAPKEEAPKVETPAPAKAEAAPAPAAEAPKAEEPKAESAPVKAAPEASEAPASPAPEKAESAEAAPAASSNEETAEDPKTEIFTLGAPKTVTAPKVIGKIDLSAINQSVRPKKKTKEERRNERQGEGDRKKRRRITGKERVDIEKAGQGVASVSADSNRGNGGGRNQNGGNRGNDNNQGGRGQNGGGLNGGRGNDNQGGRGQRRNAPAPQPEVSDEDVSKQVKETLARLTAKDKGSKKGAKWRKEKREANAQREREAQRAEQAESSVLKLTEFVTVHDLAIMMDVAINQVIATCMNLGVMVSINQRLDAETINIVAEEFGFTTEYVSAEVADAIHQEEDTEEDLESRPPVVTVMGHVDHGKTSLLDYIRKANVIAGEAGGITQHIGSYSVTLADGRHITFLDTPGHEAFTAMRARGAKVTDICIIIVAADDSVMPQTVEAINHASAAGVPIVFAINKIDKPHANPDKIKEELAAMNYLVEDWGGKYQSQDISAKQGIGVDELMEKVLLEAEMLDLKANPNRNAVGTIIESSLDKGRGYVANVLIQNGTLRVGDIVLAGNHFGKIKAMFNERNQRIKEAGPAMPALILGLNGAPTAGDTFNVLSTEQEAREIANKREQLQREQGLRTTKILTLEDIGRRRAIGNFQELNIIVKGDVDGSIEALADSLIKLSTEEIQVNVLHKAVGEISESDVTLAAASDAVIIGFQVRPSQAARRAAEREGVDIRLYSVIYQAIEEVKDAMAGMLAPELKEEVTGTAEVLETYKISKVGTIAGAIVRDGKIKRASKVRLIREGIVRYTGELGSLKRFKDDVKEVLSGYDCGLSIAGYNDIQIGDIIEGFEEVEVSREL